MRTLPLLPLNLLIACTAADKSDTAETACTGAACDSATDSGTDSATDSGTDSASDSGTDTATDRPAIVINELQASNATTLQDESGAWPDWIELYSAETEAYDLTGCTLSNDLDDPGMHVLESGTLAPGGFLVLFADGDTDQGANHLNFRLPADGGALGLYDPEGRPLTRLTYAAQATDWSGARVPDGSETWVATAVPTPGSANEASE